MASLNSSGDSGRLSRPIFRFAAIGECMVEMAPASDEGHFRMGFAGDTFNTTWYVKSLGPALQTGFISGAGTDSVSDRMLEMMDRAGIETSHILRDPDRSVGLYLITLNDGERSFSYWRNHSAARQLADDAAALEAATDDADLIYFSGITMAILPPEGRKTLLETLKRCRNAGKTVAFDSNLRPALWSSPDEMMAEIMHAAAVSDIVLPSFDDEAAHFSDADSGATCQRYLDAGASTVVVKNGAGDILFSHEGDTGTVTPPEVSRVIDTTAAGDSFNAGFLVGLHRSGNAADAIRVASRVAGHVIGQKGALVPLPPDLTETHPNNG